MTANVLPIRGGVEPLAVAPLIANTGLRQSLGRDLTLMFRPLGIEACRAFAMDLQSLECRAAWLISERGEVGDDSPDRTLDSAFPGASSVVAQLAALERDETLVHKLSPRRWVFAWRVDARHGVVAETRYRETREPPTEVDSALIRLVCDAGMRMGESSAADAPDEASASLTWPQVDRRLSRRSTVVALCLVLMATIAALAVWVGLATVPRSRDTAAAMQSQVAQLRTMAELTMARSLSTQLAGGDYGEVQEALTGFATLGYFHGAVVTNARQRIVALAGQAPGLLVGAEVPDAVARDLRPIELALGAEPLGRLHLLTAQGAPRPVSEVEGLGTLRMFVAVAFAAAAAGVGLLAWPWLRRRLREPGRA